MCAYISENMKILVTGSSGTIGTALCEELLEEGYEVIGADVKPNKWNEEVNKITILADLKKIEETTKLPRADIIIHLAANPRVYKLVLDPIKAKENIDMTFNILEYSRKKDVRKIILGSSREVYGNRGMVHSEKDVKLESCESPYTASKISSESLLSAYKECYDLNYIIFRFSNVYGKYDESDRVIPLFIEQTLKGEDLVIYGEEKYLDFTYIDDTLQGVKKAIKSFDKYKNNTYNIAYGEGVSILDSARYIVNEIGGNNDIIIKKSRKGEIMKYVADISKAKKEMGFTPQIDIEKGLKKTIAWYKEHLVK